MKTFAFLAVMTAFVFTSLGLPTQSFAGGGYHSKSENGNSARSSRGVHSPGVSRSARGRSADKNF